MLSQTVIYKIVPRVLWQTAGALFHGAPIDQADGYIHFSTADQLRETAAKHFKGQSDLILVAVATEPLGEALKWEVSRGGALFPHLYAALPTNLALSIVALALDEAGIPIIADSVLQKI